MANYNLEDYSDEEFEWVEEEIEIYCTKAAAQMILKTGWLWDWQDIDNKDKMYNCTICFTAHTGWILNRINITLTIQKSLLDELLEQKKNQLFCSNLDCEGAILIKEVVRLNATLMGYKTVENWRIISFEEAPWF